MPQTTLNAKAQLALSKGARALLVVSDPTHRNDEGQYALFASDPDADDQGIPVLRVRRSEMQPLLDACGLDATARLIDMDLIPRSELLNGATVDYVESLTRNRKTVRNVVGVLPGSDPARAARVDRDRRALRSRRSRRAALGRARAHRRDSQRRRRQRLRHRVDHRDRPCRGGPAVALPAHAGLRRLRR